MNADQAAALLRGLFEATMFIAGPLISTALMAGVVVGILQAATQINEASISFVVKVAAVLALLVSAGPLLAAHAIDFTRHSLEAIEHVVR